MGVISKVIFHLDRLDAGLMIPHLENKINSSADKIQS